MENTLQKITEAASFLEENGFGSCIAGVVLGTGLGALVNKIHEKKILSYNDIPHFPVSSVEFHKGRLITGYIGDKKVMVMQGRFHYYEGHTMQQITFPVRVMKQLGIKQLLLSNAAGGVNPGYKKGDLIVIDDHINLLPENPLRGLHLPEFGDRFTDMSEPYSDALNARLFTAAQDQQADIKKGVYAAVAGPNLETRSEYRYIRSIGADMVGMSTVPEVIVANQSGIKCAAVSVITDICDPDNLKPVNIAEIIEVAAQADNLLSNLFAEVIKTM